MRGLIKSILVVVLLVIAAVVLRFILAVAFLGSAVGANLVRMDKAQWSADSMTPPPRAFLVLGFGTSGTLTVRSLPDGPIVGTIDRPILVSHSDINNDWISVPRVGDAEWVSRRELQFSLPPYLEQMQRPVELETLTKALREADEDLTHLALLQTNRVDAATTDVELILQRQRGGRIYRYRVAHGTTEPRSVTTYLGPWNGVDGDFVLTMSSIAATLLTAIVIMLRILHRRRRASPTGWEQFDRFGRA